MRRLMQALALGAVLCGNAGAAPPRPMSLDTSTESLMDATAAGKIWKDNLPARVTKLYPSTRFRFVSQVSGGFNDARVCVVTARAMLLPVVRLPVQGAKPVYAPIRSATAFDAAPDLSDAKCRDLAHAKLTEAVRSVAASLAQS